MQNKYYRFGGFTIHLFGDELQHSAFCEPFEVEPGCADHTICVALADAFPMPPKGAERQFSAYRWHEGETFCILKSCGEYTTFAQSCGCETKLFVSEQYRGKISAMTALEAAGLFDILAQHGMLILHSSYIVTKDGSGIVFSGDSGVGKSTQAELWRKFAGAEVINGDRSLIRTDDATVHGIFYSGTSKICNNVSAPLRAIVLPRQADHNAAFTLRPQELFVRLLNQCSYYPWASDSTERMTELLERLIAKVQIIGLDCRVDEDAVRTLENILRRD